jgi:hypothetical protein
VLAEWVRDRPGSRPQGFYEFDAWQFPEQKQDESEMTWLMRIKQLGPEELAAIVEKARALITYNRGRSPESKSNFIPDHSGVVQFCAEHQLISDDDLPPYF